ncbi:hypothetical protein [Pseudomonas sp. zjy_14]|uniref:hypothetical protein n=1 Tax=Pseudomonas sp. zjy_14 TaxID=3367264 RepID=UPI00370ABBFC
MSSFMFWAVTAALALMEWLGSWCFALSVPGLKKGLISDLFAATVMVVVGSVFGTVGGVIKFQCTLPSSMSEGFSLIQKDMQECKEYGENIVTFGDMVKSTFGMNSVIAALVLYFAFKIGAYLLSKFLERRAK